MSGCRASSEPVSFAITFTFVVFDWVSHFWKVTKENANICSELTEDHVKEK